MGVRKGTLLLSTPPSPTSPLNTQRTTPSFTIIGMPCPCHLCLRNRVRLTCGHQQRRQHRSRPQERKHEGHIIYVALHLPHLPVHLHNLRVPQKPTSAPRQQGPGRIHPKEIPKRHCSTKVRIPHEEGLPGGKDTREGGRERGEKKRGEKKRKGGRKRVEGRLQKEQGREKNSRGGKGSQREGGGEGLGFRTRVTI
jgi:hypothetical protein